MHALGGAATGITSASSSNASVDSDSKDYGGGGDFELPSKVLQQLSFSHFSDALQSDFLQLQTGIKLVLFPLLAKLDPQVHNHLLDADMEPFFCLSWIITWFSHDVRDTQLVKRLFDAFIVSHPLLPTYMSISMMLHPYNRQRILDTDCDFASLHQVLASLPRNSCRVGWKRRNRCDDGGLEYISDHEDECCGGEHEPFIIPAAPRQPGGETRCDVTALTVELEFYSSSNAGAGSMISGLDDASSEQWIALDQNSVEKSLPYTSDTQGKDRENPVPFEEVLGRALHYMKHYPPSGLVALAKAYYGDDWMDQLAMLSLSSSGPLVSNAHVQQHIGLLRPCQPFSIAPVCSSHWVEKQRLRQTLGLKSSSRKDRRRKIKAIASPSSSRPVTPSKANEDVSLSSSSIALWSVRDPMEFVRLNPNHLAVIAVGYGPGLAPEILAAAMRRRRRSLLFGTVVLGVAAMGGSLYFQGSQQNFFGTAVTGGFLGGFWSSSAQSPDHGNSSFTGNDSDESPAETVAMNKVASIILPRINVLQKDLPASSALSKSRVDSKSLQLSMTLAKANVGQGVIKAQESGSTPTSQSLTTPDEQPWSAFASHRTKLVKFARVASHVVSRLFVKMILDPMTFLWRVLKREATMYTWY
jgi:hypothetical protein